MTPNNDHNTEPPTGDDIVHLFDALWGSTTDAWGPRTEQLVRSLARRLTDTEPPDDDPPAGERPNAPDA